MSFVNLILIKNNTILLSMATKPDVKSKIPMMVSRREILTERTRMVFGNNNYVKPTNNKDNKDNKKPFKNVSNHNNDETRNLKGKTKEQPDKERNANKHKHPTVWSGIETLSQDLVKHIKTSNLNDNVDSKTNVTAKNRDKTNIENISGQKNTSSSSELMKPKNCQPHSGLSLKSTVRKSILTVKPFSVKVTPPKVKLRRSVSAYDFKSARPKAETVQRQPRDKGIKRKDVPEKQSKSETLSKIKNIDSNPTKVLPEKPKNHVTTGRMSKQFLPNKDSAKPVTLKPNPPRRSNTMHAFDSAQNSKTARVFQINKSPIPKTVPEIPEFEQGKSPATPENSKLERPLSENLRAEFTPKKEIPHRGLVLNVNAARATQKKMNAFGHVD